MTAVYIILLIMSAMGLWLFIAKRRKNKPPEYTGRRIGWRVDKETANVYELWLSDGKIVEQLVNEPQEIIIDRGT